MSRNRRDFIKNPVLDCSVPSVNLPQGNRYTTATSSPLSQPVQAHQNSMRINTTVSQVSTFSVPSSPTATNNLCPAPPDSLLNTQNNSFSPPPTRSILVNGEPTIPSYHEKQPKQTNMSSSPPKPGLFRSIILIFSFTAKRDYLLLLLPATLGSVFSGLLPPYMTIMIGDAFQSFTDYTVSTIDPSNNLADVQKAKDLLRHQIGVVAIKLVCLGAATFFLSLLTHTLWAINGSKITQKLQIAIYDSVSQKELGWFEKGMKTQYSFQDKHPDQTISSISETTEKSNVNQSSMTSQSPSGLMSRFSGQTEDIRAAISGRFGLVIQYTITLIMNTILAFTKSYKLSLVILCTIPVVGFLTVLSAKMTAPLLMEQGILESTFSTEIGRLVRTISIVKAFNAQPLEIVKLVRLSVQISKNYISLVRIWALRLGICQCLSFLMFVQGFGFGSKLISSHEVTAGDVNTVFWSCLVANSYLQMLIPLLSYLEKAQIAIFNLLAIMEPLSSDFDLNPPRLKTPDDHLTFQKRNPISIGSDLPPVLVPVYQLQKKSSRRHFSNESRSQLSTILSSSTGYSSISNIRNSRKYASYPATSPDSINKNSKSKTYYRSQKGTVRELRKLIPTDFKGQLELKNVTFFYPSNEPKHFTASTSSSYLKLPNLDSVSLYFPAGQFTFIVGESGSGKSTIGAILMGLYPIFQGSVEADDFGSITWLDPHWFRSQIGLVSGLTSNFILPGTLHENIAIGVGGSRDWRTVTRKEVIGAAKFALLHEFISDLPDGYETRLISEETIPEKEDSQSNLEETKGRGGFQNLSGGQKQRLGLARAWIRNPPILILDEATSALDLTTQALMYDALRLWRANKTTICITHDLKPIKASDYVYVMQQGQVVENDYRCNLEARSSSKSLFKKMLKRTEGNRKSGLIIAPKVKVDSLSLYSSQAFSKTKELSHISNSYSTSGEEKQERSFQVHFSEPINEAKHAFQTRDSSKEKHMTLAKGFFRAMQSETGFLTLQPGGVAPGFSPNQTSWKHLSKRRPSQESDLKRNSRFSSRETSGDESLTTNPSKKSRRSRNSLNKLLSKGLQPTSDRISKTKLLGYPIETEEDYEDFSTAVILQASKIASNRRAPKDSKISLKEGSLENSLPERRRKWSKEELQKAIKNSELSTDSFSKSKTSSKSHHTIDMGGTPSTFTWSLKQTIKCIIPTLSQKWLVIFGCGISIASGAMTPLFSVVLGNLLSRIADPPDGYILRFSMYIIIISVLDGFLSFLRVFIMESASMRWLENMRNNGFENVILQDQEWFDQQENSPSNLVSRLVKDGVDGKDLIGQVLAEALTIITLMLMAFLWSLIIGWQLTLVGLAMAPVFFVIVGGGGKVGAKFEFRNKVLREKVANNFYLAISNIKAVRSMMLEPLLRERFVNEAKNSRKMFIRAAPLSGMTFGINIALTYLAEGLMFYVGGLLVTSGAYTFSRLSQVFSLIIFSVTFAGQMISSIPSYSKSVRAVQDLMRLVTLPTGVKETRGDLRIPLKGRIEFRQVNFSYPSRPDVQILKSVSFIIEPGECVGIVGASGSGKSTVATLLHRLYEPSSGSVRLDAFNISQLDSRHVREHIGIVTQHPVLFNGTVFDNVSYGHIPIGRLKLPSTEMNHQFLRSEVEKVIDQVNLTGFIESLPQKLNTKIGENSELVSTGQAQRLSIARTLLQKNRKILVFDECTSALDIINQNSILKTIEKVKNGKTSIIITHKQAVMKMCDRLIVMDQGKVVEEGKYEELIKKPNGILSTLSKSGEYTI
ncbi:hypothetical protein O181_039357 [Austropuccinia psidii MF-1]|uniref:Uncharacterized protein n=1 Tax=Austropuccinia psidii MF-1 TaxID=1389203 RepID=A0A9Q3DCR4_9BASI|nr:hypothetical protein [Austropuccinia psidii MF-1]